MAYLDNINNTNHWKALVIAWKKMLWLKGWFVSSLSIKGGLVSKTHEKYNIHYWSKKLPLTCQDSLLKWLLMNLMKKNKMKMKSVWISYISTGFVPAVWNHEYCFWKGKEAYSYREKNVLKGERQKLQGSLWSTVHISLKTAIWMTLSI